MTPQEIETFRKHNFGNVVSLLRVEINHWLIESLVAKWDAADPVFLFGSVDMCPTIEEYSGILGFHYKTDFIVSPPINQHIRYAKPLE